MDTRTACPGCEGAAHAGAASPCRCVRAPLDDHEQHQQMLLYARDLRRALTLARRRERELADAHRRLERLDRLKSDFLRFVSHELRTPLQHLSAVEMLDGDLSREELTDLREMIRAGYDRLFGLVRAGQDYLELAAQDPPPVPAGFRAAVYTSRLKQRWRGHARVRANAASVPTGVVLASLEDVEYCESVMACNALRFSPPSAGVEVYTAIENGHWRLRVRDEGIGFAPEIGAELFRPFTIGQINHHQQGSGLSLARAAILIERAGGQFEAASEGPGRGALFGIALPWRSGGGA